MLVCVQGGSEYERMLRLLAPEPFIVLVDESDGATPADWLQSGACNVIVGNLMDVTIPFTMLGQDCCWPPLFRSIFTVRSLGQVLQS